MAVSPAKTSATCRRHPVVITGAGGDLGREVAVLLSRRRERLVLVDNDPERLDGTFTSCVQISPRVTRCVADVSSWDAMSQLADQVHADFGSAHAVYNFAGLIHAGLLLDSEPRDLERVVVVDLLGTMASCRAFLPQLTETGHGQLVNISSAFGLVGVAGYSAYNAAKFGVRGFTEALQQEVDPSRVALTVVYPGGIKTGILRRATYGPSANPQQVQDRFDRSVARTSCKTAAQRIVTGVSKGRPRVVIGADAAAVDMLVRVAGTGYQRVTRRMGLKHNQG
jgi:short-subunit dehydrogenase